MPLATAITLAIWLPAVGHERTCPTAGVGVVVPVEARRQSATAALAMLRMFQRKAFSIFAPEEVGAFRATFQERQVIKE